MEVKQLHCAGTPLTLELGDGRRVRARTAVVAAGARYRRPAVDGLDRFEGRGVWYWASPIEARLCREEEIVLVGGGNSAGQAAVFLSGFASKIWILVRSDGLAESMSRYLINRIAATPNIEVLTRTELVAFSGLQEGRLDRVRWRHNPTGEETEKTIRNVFLFIGADPATHWLKDCGVLLDRNGFVRAGTSLAPDELAGKPRAPMPLESSVPGVLRLATCDAAQLSGSAPRLARARRLWPSCMRSWRTPR